MDIKTWISAFRLRTLPLAISGILMGTFTADIFNHASWTILCFSLSTALFLQILSNLANDYGDFLKGTDNDNRLGNTRALQSGKIKPNQMRVAIILFATFALISGISLLYYAMDKTISLSFIIYFLIGISAIAAAIKYTIGKNPYGYSGKGDIMVFIFFGPVAVFGTFLLHTHLTFDITKQWMALLPPFFIGLLSTGVLNTNNIRDISNDADSGKHTIPVKLGLDAAKKYHVWLISGACITVVIFILTAPITYYAWIALLAFIPLIKQMTAVYKLAPSPAFNQLLKQLSIGTLLLVLMFVFSGIISNILIVSTLIK